VPLHHWPQVSRLDEEHRHRAEDHTDVRRAAGVRTIEQWTAAVPWIDCGVYLKEADSVDDPGRARRGAVIGVTTLKRNEAEGLGFDIAANEVRKVFGSYVN
jgi:hypothetical protein